MFPDQIAYRIASEAHQGGARIPKILGELKSWQYGSGLRDLIIERVAAGGRLEDSDLDSLIERAKGQAPRTDSDAATIAPQAYSASPQSSKELASILRTAAESIDAAVPKDTPLVLLGRDMGFVLPFLRSRRPVQYFLWSSQQTRDEGTARQWRMEVPPNAVAIDTGYSGTIIDAIRRGDPTASGYLLSRSQSSKYSQLLKGAESSRTCRKNRGRL